MREKINYDPTSSYQRTGVEAARQETGTVVHGTLRAGDLIPAFFEELERRDPDARDALLDDWERMFDPNEDGYALRAYTDDARGEDFGYMLEDLFDALGEIAPEGFYFGAHPGDGSDFGFWPVEDM